MHILIALLTEGGRVAAIDLDGKQRTLTRYLENRRAFISKRNLRLAMPEHLVITESDLPNRPEAEAEEASRFAAAVADLSPRHDFILVDCPGSDTHLARTGHSHADLLVTPVNDSFIDVDLLATVETRHVEGDKSPAAARCVCLPFWRNAPTTAHPPRAIGTGLCAALDSRLRGNERIGFGVPANNKRR